MHHDLKKSSDEETEPTDPPPNEAEVALIKTKKSKYDAPFSKNLALELFFSKD